LRTFAGAAGSGLAYKWSFPLPARADAARERVAQITDGHIWVGSGWTDADLDPTVLRSVIEQSLLALTGSTNSTAALRALIPSVTDSDQRYAIKVNCVNQALPTHPRVVTALVDLLILAGARSENIVVYDRADHELVRCGYALGTGDRYLTAGTYTSGGGYHPKRIELSDGTVRLSRTIGDDVDHIINVPVLKNHSMAGVTLSLKNHFGSIDEPQRLHGRQNDGCPGIAELNAQPQIRDKTRLALIDATFGTYRSGLAGKPDFAPMTIIAAATPVAADLVGQELINKQRTVEGLDPLDARHIRLAAELGLGPGGLSQIDVVREVIHPVHDKAKPWEGSDSAGCSTAVIGKPGATATAVLGAAALLSMRNLPSTREKRGSRRVGREPRRRFAKPASDE